MGRRRATYSSPCCWPSSLSSRQSHRLNGSRPSVPAARPRRSPKPWARDYARTQPRPPHFRQPFDTLTGSTPVAPQKPQGLEPAGGGLRGLLSSFHNPHPTSVITPRVASQPRSLKISFMALSPTADRCVHTSHSPVHCTPRVPRGLCERRDHEYRHEDDEGHHDDCHTREGTRALRNCATTNDERGQGQYLRDTATRYA